MAANFNSIITDIKQRKFAPVYILMGEEAYYLDKITEALEALVVEEADKDFNFDAFYGAEADIDVVDASARQYPVMAERRLVILKEAQAMQQAKTRLQKLAPYIEKPIHSTVFALIFKGDNLNETSELMKAAKKNKDVVVFKSPLLRDSYLSAPIKEYCQSHRVAIDDKAVALLCEFVGANLSKLFGEIDKLLVAAGKNVNRITSELIERNIGISKDFNNWELVSAMGKKDYKKAMRIIEYFRRNASKNPTVMTTASLFSFFSNLVKAHYAPDKSDQGLMKFVGIKNSYALRDMKTAMANYNPRQSILAISALRNFDCKSKGIGSIQNEFDLLRELIFQLITIR